MAKKRYEIELTAEEKFVLSVGRIHPNTEELQQIEDLKTQVNNWDKVLALIQRFSVGPILWNSIVKYKISLPQSIIEWCQQSFFINHVYAQRRNSHLEKVCFEFNKQGIEPLLLKGIILANDHYPDPALRPMSDIDILVSKDKIRLAEKILLNLGGRRRRDEKQEVIREKTTNELMPFYFEEIDGFYDLHFELLAPPLSRFFNHKSIGNKHLQFRIGKAFALKLNPHNLLLMNTLHNSKNTTDNIGSLLWYNDLRLFYECEWYSTFRSNYKQVNQFFQEQKHFVNTFFNGKIPTGKQNDKQLYILFRGAERHEAENAFIRQLVKPEKPLIKLSLIIAYSFPSIDYMKQRYNFHNKLFVPYYYLLRLGIGIARGLRYFINKN